MAAGMSRDDRSPHRSRRRRRTRAPMAEINVTPMVDVMLVLLIVFMVAAPLLTVGVPVELPKTSTGPLDDASEPLTITINEDGQIFLQETPVEAAALVPQLRAIAENGYDERIFVRADERIPYGDVADVMARVTSAGFRRIGLVTDQPTEPASGEASRQDAGAPPSGPIPSGQAR